MNVHRFTTGMGEKLNQALQPGTAHYAWTEAETLVQLHGTGPWSIEYAHPANGPRRH